MSLYKYFQALDLLSNVVGLRYKGNWRYKTFLGGVTTFMYVIIAMTLAIYFLVKFVNREEAFVSFENRKNSNPPALDLSKDFNFAVSMRYGTKNILRKEIIDIQFEYVTYNLSTNFLNITKIPSILCREEMFAKSKEQFYTFGLNESLCIDNNGLSIEGSNINNYYSYIRVNFILCSNSTANNNSCLPWTQAQSIIDNTKPLANLYFLDSTFQPQDNHNFLVKFINNINVNITSANAKETNIYFSRDQLNVEQGYIYKQEDLVFDSFVIQSYRDLVSVRAANQLNSLSFNLFSSKYQSITYVNYVKFSTFLANVGGILQSVLIFMNMAVYYLNNHKFDAECIKTFYRIHNERLINQKRIINKGDFFCKYINISKKTPDEYEKNKSFEENLDLHSQNSPIKSQFNEPITNLNNRSELENINKKEFSSVLSKDIIPKSLENYEKKETEIKYTNNDFQILNMNDRLSTIPVSQHATNKKAITKTVTVANKSLISKKNDLIKSDRTGKLMISTNKLIVNLDQDEIFGFMCCPLFKSCSRNSKEKFELYRKIKKFLKSNLDLTNIVRKLMEIDMIKFLLFDDDQLVLSKLVMKPQVSFLEKEDAHQITKYNSFSDFYNTNHSQYLKDEEFFIPSDKNNMEIFLRSVENIINKKNMNDVDKKLIMNLKEIFE